MEEIGQQRSERRNKGISERKRRSDGRERAKRKEKKEKGRRNKKRYQLTVNEIKIKTKSNFW